VVDHLTCPHIAGNIQTERRTMTVVDPYPQAKVTPLEELEKIKRFEQYVPFFPDLMRAGILRTTTQRDHGDKLFVLDDEASTWPNKSWTNCVLPLMRKRKATQADDGRMKGNVPKGVATHLIDELPLVATQRTSVVITSDTIASFLERTNLQRYRNDAGQLAC
jgi:hypothetical protein